MRSSSSLEGASTVLGPDARVAFTSFNAVVIRIAKTITRQTDPRRIER